MQEYRDPEISQKIADRIKKISKRPVRLMEVCGTHTMSIFRSGIRSLLPETITLLSGPGCPVCVTAQSEIDALIEIAKQDPVIMTTFGDLMRVPGSGSSLQKEHAQGRDIRIVYSAFDALKIARENPSKKVVFPGVGFETTAPTIAASMISAKQMKLNNFYVYATHKLVPPALFALMKNRDVRVSGFLLPGHVSVIIGKKGYEPFFNHSRLPCVIAGFEPIDILQAIFILVEQIESSKASLENAYPRAVTHDGNKKAQEIMEEVFETADAPWRGIGSIPESGLRIRRPYRKFDAEQAFDLAPMQTTEPKGCACGDILTGLKVPPECPLYRRACTPIDPVGPCMVSSEGTCAAYYRYNE